MTSGDPMERALAPAWRVLQAAIVLLVLALFLWTLSSTLNPFLLFWVLVAAALPFRGADGHGLIVSLAAGLTLYWLLATTGFLLAPFVLALVLAYVLDPLVDRLEGRRVPRGLAIGIAVLPMLALLALAVVFGIPALGRQIAQLIRQAPVLLDRVVDWLETMRLGLLRLDFLSERLLERLRTVDAAAIVSFLEERQETIARRIWEGILGLGRGIGSALTILGYVVLTPVLTFYLLRDWDGIQHRLAELVPPGRRESVLGLAREYDRLLSRYMRGQFTVAVIVGTITALGLFALGFPYALLLGVVVAVFGLIPYLGLVLSLIPALAIALVSGNVGASLLKVAVVYGVAQGLEGAVISPRIVGSSVGLHPVWVVLALAVGGFYFGFVGLLIAVPVAVGVKLLVTLALERYRASELYRGPAPAA